MACLSHSPIGCIALDPGVKRLLCQLGLAPVTRRHRRGAHPQLPGLPDRDFAAGGGVDDLDLQTFVRAMIISVRRVVEGIEAERRVSAVVSTMTRQKYKTTLALCR